MSMQDTEGTSDGRILFVVEGLLLSNRMRNYKSHDLYFSNTMAVLELAGGCVNPYRKVSAPLSFSSTRSLFREFRSQFH